MSYIVFSFSWRSSNVDDSKIGTPLNIHTSARYRWVGVFSTRIIVSSKQRSSNTTRNGIDIPDLDTNSAIGVTWRVNIIHPGVPLPWGAHVPAGLLGSVASLDRRREGCHCGYRRCILCTGRAVIRR